jgi:hypothetical protein
VRVPVKWELRGSVLWLSIVAVVSNEEIELALADALASAPDRRGLRLLWDARESQTPLSSADMAWRFDLVSSLAERGLVTRAALLLVSRERALFELSRQEMQKALGAGLPSDVFTDASAALAWLEG